MEKIVFVGDRKCNMLLKEGLLNYYRQGGKEVALDTIDIRNSHNKIIKGIEGCAPNILIFHHFESNEEPVVLLRNVVCEFSGLRVIAMAEYGKMKEDFEAQFIGFDDSVFRKAVYPLFPDELFFIINNIIKYDNGKHELGKFLLLLERLSTFIDKRDTFPPNKKERHVPFVQSLVNRINTKFLNNEFDFETLRRCALGHDISRITDLSPYSMDEIELIPENYERIAEGLFHLDSVETNSGHYYQLVTHKNDEISLAAITSAVDLYANLISDTSMREKWLHEDAIDYMKKDVSVRTHPLILNALNQTGIWGI